LAKPTIKIGPFLPRANLLNKVYYKAFNQGKGTFLVPEGLPKGFQNQKGRREIFNFFLLIILLSLVLKLAFSWSSLEGYFTIKKGNFQFES